MSNYYNLDGIKTELKKYINEATAKLEAWEKVSFPVKKDGTPFKQMSKNISGATYFSEQFAMQPGEYKLRVNAWCDKSGYIFDEIYAYCQVKNLKDEAKKEKTANYQPKQTFLAQIYTYDLEDIKEAVKKRKNDLETEKAQLEEQLKRADEAYYAFRIAYEKAIKDLEEKTNKEENSALFYMICNTIKERYPYC